MKKKNKNMCVFIIHIIKFVMGDINYSMTNVTWTKTKVKLQKLYRNY